MLVQGRINECLPLSLWLTAKPRKAAKTLHVRVQICNVLVPDTYPEPPFSKIYCIRPCDPFCLCSRANGRCQFTYLSSWSAGKIYPVKSINRYALWVQTDTSSSGPDMANGGLGSGLEAFCSLHNPSWSENRDLIFTKTGHSLFEVFVDLKKAFNTVSAKMLLRKLGSAGLDVPII